MIILQVVYSYVLVGVTKCYALSTKAKNHIKYSKFIMFCMTNTKSSTHSKLNELNAY